VLDTTQAYWGAAFAGPQAMERATRGWIAGPDGRLTRVQFDY
jgi:hypothetical protein